MKYRSEREDNGREINGVRKGTRRERALGKIDILNRKDKRNFQ
jgi:hypothetical protein